jgi:hypothetical protein
MKDKIELGIFKICGDSLRGREKRDQQREEEDER